MEKIHLTWKDIDDAIDSLAYNIKSSGLEIKSICGMVRGGLIPAVMLSHKLGIKYNHILIPKISGNTLLVDDICDSGNTLANFKHDTRIITATIHYKQSAIYEPNFWYSLIQEKDWIVYPWEREDAEAIQDYLVKKKTIFNNDHKTVFH